MGEASTAEEQGTEKEEVQIGRRVYVGNLAWRTSWQDLKDHFRGPTGSVVYANVTTDQSGRSRGWGIVEFETVEEAVQAVQDKNGSQLDGRVIMVREDREDRDIKRGKSSGSRSQRNGESSGLQVVVHGIPWSYDHDQLAAMFSDYDPSFQIDMAEVIYGRDGRSRGYGTVRFLTQEDVTKAIEEFNGYELEGRNLTVKLDQFA